MFSTLLAERHQLPRSAAAVIHSSGEPRDQLQFAIAFHLGLAARLWRVRFDDQMRGLNQSEARWSALYMIADAGGGIIQTDLAAQLGIQGPTLVKLLDTLEKQGLISRRLVSNDRRVRRIAIEAKGREALVVIDSFAKKMRAHLFSGVGDTDLATTLGVLRHLSDQLEPRLVAI